MNAPANDAALMAEIGNCIRDQLHALASNPSSGRASDVACNLDGARRAVLRFREALMMEVSDAGAG